MAARKINIFLLNDRSHTRSGVRAQCLLDRKGFGLELRVKPKQCHEERQTGGLATAQAHADAQFLIIVQLSKHNVTSVFGDHTTILMQTGSFINRSKVLGSEKMRQHRTTPYL